MKVDSTAPSEREDYREKALAREMKELEDEQLGNRPRSS